MTEDSFFCDELNQIELLQQLDFLDLFIDSTASFATSLEFGRKIYAIFRN